MKPAHLLVAMGLFLSACVSQVRPPLSTYELDSITTVCAGSLCAICADNPEDC